MWYQRGLGLLATPVRRGVNGMATERTSAEGFENFADLSIEETIQEECKDLSDYKTIKEECNDLSDYKTMEEECKGQSGYKTK